MKQLLTLLIATLPFTSTALTNENASSASRQAASTETKTTTQASKPRTTTRRESSKARASLTGCLDKTDEGKRFTLTNRQGRVEVEAREDLSAYVGHEVKLEGTWAKLDTGTEGGTKGRTGGSKEAAKAGKEGGTKGRHFTATTVEEISSTCDAARQ